MLTIFTSWKFLLS